MPDWMPPTIAVAIITVIGTIVGVAMTRRTAKETNEINEADRLIQNLATEVERQDSRLDKMDAKITEQGRRIAEQGEQIDHLRWQERSLRWYVNKLVDKIRALGHEPPTPPADLNL